MPGPMAIAAAPAVIGGIASFFGQKSANKANRKEAQRNRVFQERMRNTEWQAGVEDMRKAGLNPALAYQQGGASSPSGAVAASQESDLGEGVSSAMQVKQMQEGLKEVKQRARGAKADADYKDAYNAAHGVIVRKDGSVQLDLTMPGIKDKVQAEISSAKAIARLNEGRIPEQEALASLFKGKGGETLKGSQLLIPLILRALQGVVR